MKNYIFVTVALAAILLSGTNTIAQQKTGYIDIEEAMRLLPGKDSAQAAYNDYETQVIEQYNKMLDEYEGKTAKFNADSLKYSPEIRTIKRIEIEQLAYRVELFKPTFEEQLQKKYDELITPYYDKATALILEVAAAHDLNPVDIKKLPNFPGATDLLPLLKKKLGL